MKTLEEKLKAQSNRFVVAYLIGKCQYFLKYALTYPRSVKGCLTTYQS